MIPALAGLLVVALGGAALVRLLAPQLRGAACAGASILIGSGVAALTMFVLAMAGVSWSRVTVLLAFVVVAAIAVLFARKRRVSIAPAPRRYTPAALIFDALSAVVVAAYARFALIRPLYEWDFFGIWGLKGRFFFDARTIDWMFIRTNISHPDYPLLVPLMFDFLSFVRGTWDERAIALWYVALAAALVLVVRGIALEELGSHAAASIAALAVAFPSMNIWVGLAEGAVMAFGCAGLILLRRALHLHDSRLTHLAAVLLGLAAWSKNEGLALIAVAAAAAFLTRWNVRDSIALWPAAIVIAPWLVARALLHLPTDFLVGDVIARVVARLRDPQQVLVAYGSSPPDQIVLWLVAGLVLLLYAREYFPRERFLYAAVAAQTFLFVAQGLATRADFRAHVSLTMNRIPQQILPAVVFLAAMVLLATIASREAEGSSSPARSR